MINITGVGKRVCQAQGVIFRRALPSIASQTFPPLYQKSTCAPFFGALASLSRKKINCTAYFSDEAVWDREYRESAAARMCIFQSGSDIPPLVRLSLRTLQYLVIPLLSLAILCIGVLHLGKVQIGSSCCDFPSFQVPGNFPSPHPPSRPPTFINYTFGGRKKIITLLWSVLCCICRPGIMKPPPSAASPRPKKNSPPPRLIYAAARKFLNLCCPPSFGETAFSTPEALFCLPPTSSSSSK